jgi:hypothetical protein
MTSSSSTEHNPNGWSPRDANDWNNQSYQGLFDQQLSGQLIGGWDAGFASSQSGDSNNFSQPGPESEQ